MHYSTALSAVFDWICAFQVLLIIMMMMMMIIIIIIIIISELKSRGQSVGDNCTKVAVHDHACRVSSYFRILHSFKLIQNVLRWTREERAEVVCLRKNKGTEPTLGCIDCRKVAGAAYTLKSGVGGFAGVCSMLVHGCIKWICDPAISCMRCEWNVGITNSNRSGCRVRKSNCVWLDQKS